MSEQADLDARWHEYLRQRIARGELLYDGQCREFYEERSGAALDGDEQQLLKTWQQEGVIRVLNTYSSRTCDVSLAEG